ncbi:MAG TPA: hypothetical protein VLT57_08820, partial [Bryobacteraceae bacterium]|nr:hypothetical protein [Bryobacteraceae bacterium]
MSSGVGHLEGEGITMRAMRKVWMTAALLPLLATADQHVIGLSFGKKKVPVTINHPASLAVALKGKTVA